MTEALLSLACAVCIVSGTLFMLGIRDSMHYWQVLYQGVIASVLYAGALWIGAHLYG